MRNPGKLLKTVVKLAIASLAVGLVLSLLGITPGDLLDHVTALAQASWALLGDTLEWAGAYMLLGALVVLPLWLARRIWKRLQGGDGPE